MTINSYKTGPGTLTLGSGPLNVSAQVTSMAVEWTENVESEDDVNVLSGETLDGEDNVTYDARLKGTLLQDLDAAGVVSWSWANKGTEQDFTFVPSTAEDRGIEGTVRPVPIKVGGDVKARATSDIDWACIGDPVLGDATP